MQKPLLDHSECDHVVLADLGIGRQVVQQPLGETKLAAMLHEWCEVGEFLLYGRFNKVSNARLWS